MNGLKRNDFLRGLKNGAPICLAYLAVSFTFGLLAENNGIPVWIATLISATNLTSAGQFAGLNMMILSTSLYEIAITVFVINSRYVLMGLSLSQQLETEVGTVKRIIMSLFITDEIYAVASAEGTKLSFPYYIGLATTPYLGWTIGTLTGGLVNSVLPQSLQIAANVALYCMFIAIFIPPARKSKAVLVCVAISAGLSCALYFIPGLNKISFGFRTVIATVLSAAITALIFPVKERVGTEETNEKNAEGIE